MLCKCQSQNTAIYKQTINVVHRSIQNWRYKIIQIVYGQMECGQHSWAVYLCTAVNQSMCMERCQHSWTVHVVYSFWTKVCTWNAVNIPEQSMLCTAVIQSVCMERCQHSWAVHVVYSFSTKVCAWNVVTIPEQSMLCTAVTQSLCIKCWQHSWTDHVVFSCQSSVCIKSWQHSWAVHGDSKKWYRCSNYIKPRSINLKCFYVQFFTM